MTRDGQFDVLLALIRLGDADRLGWWRSHSVDETAEYVLGHAFPSTWMASGLELAMESARIRHDAALGRATAVHIFSDYLPFHRHLTSWLIERKLEQDAEPLAWLSTAEVEVLRGRLGPPMEGERRGDGLYMGEVTEAQLHDEGEAMKLLSRLASGYVSMDDAFIAPYLDLTA